MTEPLESNPVGRIKQHMTTYLREGTACVEPLLLLTILFFSTCLVHEWRASILSISAISACSPLKFIWQAEA